MIQFSVVIPTYNRARTIERAMASAVRCVAGRDDCEILLVDDASTDDSAGVIERRFGADLATGRIRITRRDVNGGVNAARNLGVREARGEWLLFLDSDDEFVVSASVIERELNAIPGNRGLVFFRSVTTEGTLSGPEWSSIRIVDLQSMIRSGLPGECMAVVKRQLLLDTPFEERFRGFEGITWGAIVRATGPTYVSPVVTRKYSVAPGTGRLSSRRGVYARSCQLARGWVEYARRFPREMGPFGLSKAAVRAAFYAMMCPFARLFYPPKEMRN